MNEYLVYGTIVIVAIIAFYLLKRDKDKDRPKRTR